MIQLTRNFGSNFHHNMNVCERRLGFLWCCFLFKGWHVIVIGHALTSVSWRLVITDLLLIISRLFCMCWWTVFIWWVMWPVWITNRGHTILTSLVSITTMVYCLRSEQWHCNPCSHRNDSTKGTGLPLERGTPKNSNQSWSTARHHTSLEPSNFKESHDMLKYVDPAVTFRTGSVLFGTVFRPHTISPIDDSKYASSSWQICFLQQQ